jgi:hypothetical protein
VVPAKVGDVDPTTLKANTDAAAQLVEQRQQAAQQLAANQMPVAAEDYLGFLSAVNALGGLLSGQQLKDPAQELLARRKQERDEHVNRMMFEMRQASDDAMRMAEEKRQAEENAGLASAALLEAQSLSNPEERAVAQKLLSSGNGRAALAFIKQVKERERWEEEKRLQHEERRYKIKLDAISLKERQLNYELLRKQWSDKIKNENAKNFFEYTEGKQLEIFREQLDKFKADKELEPWRDVAHRLLDVHRILGPNLQSPEALKKLESVVGLKNLLRRAVPYGTSETVELDSAISDLGAAFAFARAGKTMSENERNLNELGKGISLKKYSAGNVTENAKKLAAALEKISDLMQDVLNERTSTYTAIAPPMADELRKRHSIFAPGYFSYLRERVGNIGSVDLANAPVLFKDPKKQKEWQSQYRAKSLPGRLEAWAKYKEMFGEAPTPPKSLGTFVDNVKKVFD